MVDDIVPEMQLICIPVTLHLIITTSFGAATYSKYGVNFECNEK